MPQFGTGSQGGKLVHARALRGLLRFNAKKNATVYAGSKEIAAVFLAGRFDQSSTHERGAGALRRRDLRAVPRTGETAPLLTQQNPAAIRLKLADIFASNRHRDITLNIKRLTMNSGKLAVSAAMLCGALLTISPVCRRGAGHPAATTGPGRPAGAAGQPPAVTGTNVNLRQGPGTSYTVITLIPAGAPVNVGGSMPAGARSHFQGQNGYIIATALGPPSGPAAHRRAQSPVDLFTSGRVGPLRATSRLRRTTAITFLLWPYGYGYGPRPYWRGGYYRRW